MGKLQSSPLLQVSDSEEHKLSEPILFVILVSSKKPRFSVNPPEDIIETFVQRQADWTQADAPATHPSPLLRTGCRLAYTLT
jgi:hypothetical protein